MLLAAAVWPGYATAQDVSGSDRFKFFNECRPMDLVVEDCDDNDDAEAIGLTRLARNLNKYVFVEKIDDQIRSQVLRPRVFLDT